MTILVTRPAIQAKATCALLQAKGFETVVSPLMRVEALPHPQFDPGTYSAIAVTSANAAPALARNWPKDARDVRIFTTGEASAQAIRSHGFTRVTAHTGDGADLAKTMIAALKAGQAILYPCAETRRSEFENAMKAAGMRVEAVVTYRTLAASAFCEAAEEALRLGAIQAVLLYSPRSAKIFSELYNRLSLPGTEAPRFFCLSKAVAMALGGNLYSCARFSKKPNEGMLIDLLDAHLRNRA